MTRRSSIIWHPKAIPGLSALAATEPLDSWKDWLAFHAIESSAAFLPKAFVDERFNFYGKALSGIPELRPRWQRGMDFTSDALGEAVGKLYARTIFPGRDAKRKCKRWSRDLVEAFGKRIDALTWMSPETKAQGQGEAGHAEGRRRAIPTSGAITPASKSSKATRSATRSAPNFSSIAISSRNCISRSTAANGG